MTCGQVWWPILRICALRLTQSKPFMLRRLGSSWGFGALLKGLTTVVVLRVERERWLFTTKSKWLDNWDCLGFWGIKKGVHFYHCRVVVSTHCKDTFISKWRYFASNVSFKIKNIIILIQVIKDFKSLTVISVKHCCKFNPACFTCLKMIKSWKH